MRVECNIECKKFLKKQEIADVLSVNEENLIVNGGNLKCRGLLYYDYSILVKLKDKVIGYTLLAENCLLDNSIYVMQVAVANGYKHQGIGSAMYDYVKKYAKNYEYFTANVQPFNTSSLNFHHKQGFKEFGEKGPYGFQLSVKVNAKLSFKDAQPEVFYINQIDDKNEDNKNEVIL